MDTLRLHNEWEAATFVERENRFCLLLEKDGTRFRAYIPNTGQMEEFLVRGAKFFVSPVRTEKFNYRVVSALYQDNFVLLDTVETNHLVNILIEQQRFSFLENVEKIEREKSFGRTRLDFLVHRRRKKPLVLEVKTCTLCHNGVAMFPDAPSLRAIRHIESLNLLAGQGYESRMLCIIPNRSANTFMPNFHTDYDFTMKFLEKQPVNFTASRISLIDPVTVDLGSLKDIEIDYDRAFSNCTPAGSYILVLKNESKKLIPVGKLGTVSFEKGFYVYAGSALGGLDARLSRHARKRKKAFWHIDFIAPRHMHVEKVFAVRRKDKKEAKIANGLKNICNDVVKGFGASDTSAESHLFFFKEPPHRSKHFMDIVLDLKTFTDTTDS
jgi:sugar fermentation stimulation protein A